MKVSNNNMTLIRSSIMKKLARYNSISSYVNLASYFKDMAKKGYMISYIHNGYHYFDEITPAELDFKVVIFNKFDLSIYGNRKKYIKDMKIKGWEYIFRNSETIVFYKKSSNKTLNQLGNGKQQYEMVKSVWNRKIQKNILKFLIGLVLYGSLIYRIEFPAIIINENFTKLFMILTDFLILLPILTKTPWWLFKNKKNIRIGNELNHRKKFTDKLLDIYMYFIIPIIIMTKWLLVFKDYNYKKIGFVFLILSIPLIAYIFFKSKYFQPYKLKPIRFVIYFAVLAIFLFSVYIMGFYFISN